MNSVSIKTEVAKLFFEINNIFKRNMGKCFEDTGITRPQAFVIGTLIKCGEMKLTDLGKELRLSNSTVSGIIDRLEKQQLVVRTRSEEDRRIVYVKVTPKFEEMHKGFLKKAEESFENLLGKGTPEEIGKIIEGLNTIKKIMNR